MTSNKAAWLDEKSVKFRIGDAPMPQPGPDEVVVKNHAIAVNTVDWHMQDIGIFVQQWPTILGSDVAGEIHEVGSEVTRFKKGDRVVGHAINLATGKPQDGAYALFSTVPVSRTAHLPNSISFAEGSVLPLALDASAVGLIKYLRLPYPSVNPSSSGRTVLVYGASSAVGSIATQLAAAAGARVLAITSAKNAGLAWANGAKEVFDYRDPELVKKVVEAVRKSESFIGILDAISTPETTDHDMEILTQLGGGSIATTHPPPDGLPDNIKATMIWPVDEITAPFWEQYLTPALKSGSLRCIPKPLVTGNGLECLQEALDKNRAGVSATKLVVELD